MTWIVMVLLAGQQATAAAAVGQASADPAAFGNAVAACSPATLQTPHPLVRGFEIEHRIEGDQDGTCRYAQSMPGDMRMECGFSAAGRQAYAAEFEELAAGRMSGSSQEKPAWADECEIVMPDGKRLPAFGTTRTT